MHAGLADDVVVMRGFATDLLGERHRSDMFGIDAGVVHALANISLLHDRSDRYFRFQAVQVPIREQSHEEHMALVGACRKRDAKLGAKLLEQHVKTAAQQIMSVIEAVVSR